MAQDAIGAGPLTGHDLVAVFLDGKSVAGDALVIAVGVTLQGEKAFLGVMQTATENARVLTEFLQGLVARMEVPTAGSPYASRDQAT